MICEKYKLHKPVCDQPQYNMIVRDKLEKDYRALFKTYNYGTTVWSPLLGGILTGKYNNGIPEECRANTFKENPMIVSVFNRYFAEDKKETYTKML